MDTQPSSAHLASFDLCLRSLAAKVADPAITLASGQLVETSGDVTVIIIFITYRIHIKHLYSNRQVRFYTLWRMALAFTLVKQMLKLENRKMPVTLAGT